MKVMIPEMILVVTIGIIAIINSTINHDYDPGDDFNSPVGIIAVINSTVSHIMIPVMIFAAVKRNHIND